MKVKCKLPLREKIKYWLLGLRSPSHMWITCPYCDNYKGCKYFKKGGF